MENAGAVLGFGDVDDDHVPPRLLWVRIGRIDVDEGHGQLALWLPNEGAFQKAVADERLPGELENGDVVLHCLDPAALAVVSSGLAWDLFDWEEPWLLVRVKGSEPLH